MRHGLRIIVLAIAAGRLTVGAASGQEEGSRPVRLSEVPRAVAQAAVREAPGVRFSKAVLETSTGDISSYTVTGQDARGRSAEVVLWPDGTVVSVRAEVPLNQVPASVVARLKAAQGEDEQLAGFRPSKAARLTLAQLDGTVDYILSGKNAKGEALEARVSDLTGNVDVTQAAEGEAEAAPAADPAGMKPTAARRGEVIATSVIVGADDFMVDIYHNGEKVPDEKRQLIAESFGAASEKVDIEVRRGDWLVFNVVNNRLRWDGAYYFAAAGKDAEGKVTFVSKPGDDRWSSCDDPGRVPAFIADPKAGADHRVEPVSNPWGGGDGIMTQHAGEGWGGEPVWGKERNTWIKFNAR